MTPPATRRSLRRRTLLKLAAGTGAALVTGPLIRRAASAAVPRRLPILFVSHGTAATALDKSWAQALRKLGASVGKPRAIVIASSRWLLGNPLRFLTGDVMPAEQHDFDGPAPALAKLHYPCKGSSAISLELENEFWNLRIQAVRETTRGLDYGAWVPLMHMFPKADIPVLQMSIPPKLGAGELARIAAPMFTFRSKGILFIGSGGAVWNPSRFGPAGAPVEPWAKAFDGWLAERLDKREDADLIAWKQKAPSPELAHPNEQSLAPLFMVLGAADRHEKVKTVFSGFRNGSLSMRAFRIG